MVYSLTYRRPPHVASSNASVNGEEKTRSIGGASQSSGMSYGIPDALSFDRIISGGTCPVRSQAKATFHPIQSYIRLANCNCSLAPPVIS